MPASPAGRLGVATRTPEKADPAVLLARASEEMRWERPAAALQLLREAVALDPTLVAARVGLGVAHRKLHNDAEAEAAFRRALELDARCAVAHHNLGELYRRGKRLEDARGSYEAALRLEPQATPSCIGLGHVLLAQGDYRAAVDCYRSARAASSSPPAELHKGLATALNALGDREGALEAYRSAVASLPGSAETHCDLAEMLLATGDCRSALNCVQEAIRVNPESPLAQRLRAVALAANGDIDAADASLRTLVRPGTTPAQRYLFLAHKLHEFGRVQCATDLYRKALECEPGNVIAAHHLASLTQANPDHPAEDYVRELFDGFADNFDTWLSGLGYAVPTQLVAALLELRRATAPWDVLDLGCGTGLVGAAIATHSRELVGVDLSPNMLRRARQRQVYSRLLGADLITALQAEPPCRYDVITAADVFIYVGNLDAVVPAVRRALRPGGVFAFSVESLEDQANIAGGATPQGFRLCETGRYAHSSHYLEELARRHDFEIQLLRTVHLRSERQVPIMGQLSVWQAST
jgi:predicted TPR repeat methyltransferase